MEFSYHRDEETGIYAASISLDNEQYLTLSAQANTTSITWTSDHDVQSAFKATVQAFGEPDPRQPGILRPLSRGNGEWSLPPHLSNKRSPHTITEVIATQPHAIHSVLTIHDAVEVSWHRHQLSDSWPVEARHSVLHVQASRAIGQLALCHLLRETASPLLKDRYDEILNRIEGGDFWQPYHTEAPQIASQTIPFHSAA